MSFTVFLGHLPTWVTADDIKSWLTSENLVSDSIKVIRNPETQESKGFAFIEAPNAEEMQAIIRRFNNAPLEDRFLRANPAQPPRSKQQQAGAPANRPSVPGGQGQPAQQQQAAGDRNRNRGGKKHKRPGRDNNGPQSAFAEELAKAL
ncbi:MAG TPA: RNA-binding protein [Bryobacteraceae bacterium]|jgi:RNA recognition motif-containing protein|nr:RNA-binding protein [Bryobacteraceae bacterium]